ncbi:MAG: hypothetical protein ACFBSG_08460 [Leptolyngbyaceae cyanobacterium]
MAYWEFLLQKEGDRDWLPLETAHVEISEGRYRIIAHTSYCGAAVNIQLSRLLTDQLPPQRKTLKRLGETNTNGLMVVIPFTHLTPGRWTVSCEAASQATAATPPWKYGVQLEVLAIESGMEYWDTELDEASFAEQFTASQVVTANQGTLPSSDPSPIAEPKTVNQGDRPSPPNQLLSVNTPLEDLPLRLQLQHQALVAQAGSPLSLQGQVTTFSQVEGLVGEGTLWLQLRNPETGTVVGQTTQAISIASLPSRFQLSLPLPSANPTRLLVGELSLWTALEPPQVLAIQGFTVTLNLDDLLELVANQAEQTSLESATFTAAADEATASVRPADSEPDNVSKDKIETPLAHREVPFRLVYLPASGLTLPPVIYNPIDKKSVGAPTLPLVSPQSNARRPTSNANPSPAEGDSRPVTLPPISPQKATTEAGSTSVAPGPSEPKIELPNLGSTDHSPQAASPTSKPDSSTQAIPTAAPTPPTAFQPDLQGRFWHRLSALAEAAQKAAAERKAKLEAAGVEDLPPEIAAALQQDSAIAAPTTAPEGPVNYEVVIYEDDESSAAMTEQPTSASAPMIEVLAPDEPDRQELGSIPVPEWVFPQGELVAGTPLPITIRLPAYPRRLAVKVWVTDLQTRTLVDRPRWLMNWTSTAEGEQTAFLQLQVPLGSLEAQFEAITIDLTTQQESYKISTVRSIAPVATTSDISDSYD